jgi:mono/diheme cytochrome c family protein
MKSKLILTFIFLSLTAVMMWMFVYFGNQDLHITQKNPDWNAITPTSDTIKKGHDEYQKSCSKCHGIDHEGSYKAPVLSDDQWIYPNDRDSIFKLISEGTADRRMMGWKTKIRTEDIQALTLYILSLKETHNN